MVECKLHALDGIPTLPKNKTIWTNYDWYILKKKKKKALDIQWPLDLKEETKACY